MTRWEAFRFISDALQCALGRETVTIDAERVSWDAVLQLASEHVATPILAWALREAQPIPDEVRDYLNVTLDLNRRRNEIILDCLESALAVLNLARREPLLLKGAEAILDGGLYPDVSTRYLSDLDILVPKSRLTEASVALNKVDFHASPGSEPTKRWVRPPFHHLPPLIHDRQGVAIEVHQTISVWKFEPILPTVMAMDRRIKRSFRGSDYFVLCPTDRIIHNIVHSQLHHGRHEQGMVELRQLFELTLLVSKFGNVIDWQEVENRFRAADRLEALQSQAEIVRALFAVGLKTSGPDNPVYLRRLQSSIESPSPPPSLRRNSALTQITSDYFKNFLKNPLLAVNLLNPFWWPGRISSIWKMVRPDSPTTAGPK